MCVAGEREGLVVKEMGEERKYEREGERGREKEEEGRGERERERQTNRQRERGKTTIISLAGVCLPGHPLCIDTFNSSIDSGSYTFNATTGLCERFPYGCTALPVFGNLQTCQSSCNPGSESVKSLPFFGNYQYNHLI